MVTFSIPGDDVVEATNGTPRSRPPLPFAKRAYTAASPFGSSSAKRLGTPHPSSGRKLLTTRDEVPSSSLNKNSITTARNIFRASTITDSPPASTFSPSIPNSTMKKVFAPGATPEPSRMYRESMAQATPRGLAAKTATKELFPMRISSPPSELTGEVLTQKVPKEWNSKGSIYADQFLAHLCPPELDEEQRRQFFCILDLRRLKYAANEIFAKKDWKLNVINFAKEFEKSRSIILLRYGLYEFQNVKPSKDVLKRWRREHGLPEPEEEEEASESTPSRSNASKKRKATDDVSETLVSKGKRRATDQLAELTPSASAGKNKRKASVSEEQPTKMQKSTPSSSKSLFEKIANKSAANKPAEAPTATVAAAAKPHPFTANKPATSSSLARSVFTSLKPPASQAVPAAGSNIFGYLSDASSAKNSGVDADAESESDSEQDDSQEAGQSDEPSVAASGAGDTASQTGSGMFGNKPTFPAGSGLAPGLSTSAPDTRESTPGRSLFDRVTKGTDGQPIRVEEKVEEVEPERETESQAESQSESQAESVQEKPAVADQTWNPSTTPIKFATSSTPAPTSSLFGNSSTTNSTSSIFAPKATASSNIFGAAKVSPAGANTDAVGNEGGESDKENESQSNKTGLPAAQPTFGSSMFGTKPAATEVPKPASSLFGGNDASAPKVDPKKTEGVAPPSLFGQASKAPETVPSTLFGAKAAPTDKTPATEAQTTTSLFGGASSTSAPATANAGSLFGAKPSSSANSLFGSGASTPVQQPSFGATPSATAGSTEAKAEAPKPIFKFGIGNDATSTTSKPLFGAPKSPPAAAASDSLFGSPMKQDDPSPAKKRVFNGDSNGRDGAPPQNVQPAAPTSLNLFGASSAPSQSNTTTSSAGPIHFGGPSSNAGSAPGSFSFSFGGGAPTTATTTPSGSFNNPFASGANGNNTMTSAAPAPGGMFTFSAGPSAPSGTSSTFQFGAGSGNASTPAATGGSVFGTNQGTNNPTPIFGGASGTGSAPSFNFSAGGAASQGTGSVFGSNQAVPAFNLQPPAGGSTTTGTNSPINLGGGSSLATTPAAGTPEPSAQADATKDGDAQNEEGEKHEQINLVDAIGEEEEVLHEVRAKVLKFVPASADDADDKPKSKSPWSTQGVGQLRLLKHKETNLVRLLLRAEPRGHVALNRAVLPKMSYKADEKYVKLTTSNEKGDGLETWMIQVKTKDLAKELAEALEKHKGLEKN
ncbi:hypothetical protein QQS21_002210 [Conoideocrella luteorostrata]|uniref:RanBD1 domain-containing protein n=1 Tax=Conoideocrella luteorostrata TaxID=1105319 RepID=A0AAJ0G1E4_9HYPO|nr:hypothetical protein QQS21_002210 [Conoideocrella luteorostrata]